MKILLVVLVILTIGLQYRLWTGQGSLAHVHQLEKQIIKQRAENERLKERNRMLAAEVEALKNGTDAIEAAAREELGLIKDGETFYKIVEKE